LKGRRAARHEEVKAAQSIPSGGEGEGGLGVSLRDRIGGEGQGFLVSAMKKILPTHPHPPPKGTGSRGLVEEERKTRCGKDDCN